MIVVVALLACAPGVLEISATPDASGLDVEATLPLERLELRDGSGALVSSRQLRPKSPVAALRVPLSAGTYSLRGVAGAQSKTVDLEIPFRGPLGVHIEAPLGQDSQGTAAEVAVPRGAETRVGVVLTAHQDTPFEMRSKDASWSGQLVAGERKVVVLTLEGAALEGEVRAGNTTIPFHIEPVVTDPSILTQSLRLLDIAVPAHPDGSIDRTVSPGRIELPSRWWGRVLDRFALGFRARDDLAPRTHVSVAIRNDADAARNLLLTLRMEQDGQPVHAFRPRMREAEGLTEVRRLVRVPARQTIRTALPLYLDRAAVQDGLQVEAVVEARWLGSSLSLESVRAPVVVRRGNGWASAIFGMALGAMALGWAGVAWGVRRWLAWGTRDLTTVAVFGSLAFTVGTASQVLGMGVATVLGPFAPFALGLADDTARLCLLGALLALVPRPGAFALATLVGWGMRAVALGSVHPVDLLYLGSTIALTESTLWLFGVTRVAWTRGSAWAQWGRLVGGLALPNALGTGIALAVSMVVYRLYYADWYLLAVVLVPGWLYAVIGCAVAVPFATSLRRVG